MAPTIRPLALGLIDEMTELVAVCPQDARIDGLPSPPVAILRYGRARWPFGRRRIAALAGELGKGGTALLHSLDAGAAGLTGRLARLTGLGYMVSCYSLAEVAALPRRDECLRAVLGASEPICRRLQAKRRLYGDRIRLLRPGVYQAPRATCFSRAAHSTAIVAGGPMNVSEPLETAIRAFRSLDERGYDCAFFVIGSGAADRQLRACTAKLGLLGKLTFVDQKDAWQLPGIFKAADVYVSTRTGGNVDFHSLLAMAGGIPVLAAEAGASDFLTDGETAVIFKPRDAKDLATKLAALLDDHAAAGSLVDKALAHLRANHSLPGMIAALTDIYRRAGT